MKCLRMCSLNALTEKFVDGLISEVTTVLYMAPRVEMEPSL